VNNLPFFVIYGTAFCMQLVEMSDDHIVDDVSFAKKCQSKKQFEEA